MATFTILGADGFVGSSLAEHLETHGHACQRVGRQDSKPEYLGHVVFAIGLTADFRTRPFDTIEAHVSALLPILRPGGFDSFTYLSSTRVYGNLDPNTVADEAADLTVNSNRPSDLYNISKLAGESLCLSVPNETVRIARLSNIYGAQDRSQNFLTAVLRDAVAGRQPQFFNAMGSAKDYIDVRDVVQALEIIALRGKSRVINVAAGQNVSDREIAALIEKHTGRVPSTKNGTSEIRFPPISIQRMVAETGVRPRALTEGFPMLIEGLRPDLPTHAKSEGGIRLP